MLVELQRLGVPPGQKVLLKDINWQEFEAILEELGEHRSARIAYEYSCLEIVTPLPEHEANKVAIGDFIKAILEELDIEFYSLGSTTFKNRLMQQGIEPDDCFYIENEAKVRGKNKIDLTVDPPPDLALEIDITSRTHPSIYAALGVPELWRFEAGRLQINRLQDRIYVEVESSPNFPNLPLKEMITTGLERVKREGRNKTMKAFRAWIKRDSQLMSLTIHHFPLRFPRNLAAKHDVIVDIVEQQNRNEKANKSQHEDQGTGRCRRFVNGNAGRDDVGENDESQTDK